MEEKNYECIVAHSRFDLIDNLDRMSEDFKVKVLGIVPVYNFQSGKPEKYECFIEVTRKEGWE